MNIFDLTESPKMGRPADFTGIQSADDVDSPSPIGSGTSKREDKNKPVTMMGVPTTEDVNEGWFDASAPSNEKWFLKKDGAIIRTVNGEPFTFNNKEAALAWAKKNYKVSFDQQRILPTTNPDKNLIREPRAQMEAGKTIKPNFKMPPESLQDKMYRQHQELRKKRGAPSPEEYKERIAQKQKEIDDLKEGILDRAAPKLPKPRNPADQVLQSKVNAGGRHLDKKRRQELNPKHKHQDPMAESLRPGERHHFETDPETGKRVYKGIRGDQQDAPQRAKDDPAAKADQERRAHIQHDRGMTEAGSAAQQAAIAINMKKHHKKPKHVDESQVTKITDYDLWLDEVKALGAEIHPQKDRNVLVAQSWDGDVIGKFHLGKGYGFINQSGELDETIRKINSQYRLLSKKGKNLGTFDTKAGAEKHEREVQYFKHKGMEEATGPGTTEDLDEGWKGKLAGAVFAGLAALGGGAADAQQVNLPGPQVSYIATVQAEINGEIVTRSTNMGSNYKSEADVRQAVADYMESKGIIRYRINIDQKYDQPNYGYKNRDTATGGPSGNYGVGDYIFRYIDSQIPYPANRNTRGGYATKESIEEDIERHLMQLRHAGYDIVQEEWSDKYKRSINCSNPKGFSQKAHCAGKKKNEDVTEEEVRLDPKCWKGKKIGNPKTKMKGGVRVNNCVPK
jgi:hypothetical protein